eukprot:2738119-Pyramimonas_sp.AAC.1
MKNEKDNDFLAVLECIIDQGTRDTAKLKFFCIESYIELSEVSGETSQADEVIEILSSKLKDGWAIWPWLLGAEALGLPQVRQRMHICGRR